MLINLICSNLGKKLKIFMYSFISYLFSVCMCLKFMYIHHVYTVRAGARRGQWILLVLELQALVNHFMLVLTIGSHVCARAASAPNC